MRDWIPSSAIVCTFAYATLLIQALTRKWRYVPLIVALVMSTVWSAYVSYSFIGKQVFIVDTLPLETLKNAAWFFLLASLLSLTRLKDSYALFRQRSIGLSAGVFVLAALSIEAFPDIQDFIKSTVDTDLRFVIHVITAIAGLILIEQLYRNTPLALRWHVKFLCIASGTLFAFDLFMYSKSLLYKHLDYTLWASRNLLHIFTTILLIFSLKRIETLVSTLTKSDKPQKITFYSTGLLGCGLYLITMSIAGYYLKRTEAPWNETAQTLFLFLTMLLMGVSFTSGRIRAITKVYFSKHFFQYRYDYREEWLKISRALAQLESLQELKNFTITTLTNLVESSGGGLWMRNDQGRFFLAAEQNLRLTPQEMAYLRNSSDDLPNYLNNKQWVIDFFELAHAPEVYEDIDLSPWCYEDSQVWLIVPLFHRNHLEAFVVLTQRRIPRKLNWEDHDLLKTVGMQLANALALHKASDQLANNRQFEAYHRLSAYLVHDLKNITAQVGLIVKNAEKHKHNPEFVDDTIATLAHVENKMRQMVEQLRQGQTTSASLVDLVDIVSQVKAQYRGEPILTVSSDVDQAIVYADKGKLTTILANLIQNSEDAIQTQNGLIKLELNNNQGYAAIALSDNGIGMDQTFIAERLFKPFDTTKGNAGMGIGVYEAREYISKNAGQLTVDSKPGEGTRFEILFPLAKSQQPDEA
ncbi:MAG: PEP-CTERM system histidine kinase PrsK [Methylomonas sp.]|nr:PEP-CTERM system histidine kinase PrsK [Methylomonas sp.]PPD22139.1 MAG: PEP-CTERM system histidine kinase PrsK [Methylomonas sp.]PPD25531.1 MAG: PEP-CTERM system histidine kinase PrsK [Methylomonas sp.]PPD36323.1 MAG: PEP-CTERM system histidine kinase PrsK [Methylomonas sp.]PPD40972.1 MAG: PEP-CTERM system histidine kinase PrsK [Methylomonas sp.]